MKFLLLLLFLLISYWVCLGVKYLIEILTEVAIYAHPVIKYIGLVGRKLKALNDIKVFDNWIIT